MFSTFRILHQWVMRSHLAACDRQSDVIDWSASCRLIELLHIELLRSLLALFAVVDSVSVSCCL